MEKSNKNLSRQARRKAQRQRAKDEKSVEKNISARTKKWKRISFYAVLALVVSGVGLLAYAKMTKDMPGRALPILGNQHIPSVTTPHIPYNSDPPTSGPHVTQVARWGIHNELIAKELQLHNLEDGGVVVQYNCKDCGELVRKLERIVSPYSHTILAPYPGMDSRIALTAWGRIDKFNEFDEKRIVRFIEAYIGKDHHAPY